MRYLPLTDADRRAMLAKVGVADIDALFADVPADKRLDGLVDLPKAKGEMEVERVLAKLAAQNTPAGSVPFFVGAGAYKHHVPASVDHLIQRSEFLTSYTPYQPEIAQGTLQYLFEFQTQVAMLTAMEVANASMYDGSTAASEAVLMAHRITKRHKAVLAGNLHPHYRETIETVARLAEHRGRRPAGYARGQAGPGGGDRSHRVVRGGADARLLRPPARSHRAGRQGARGRRPAGCRVHRARRARAGAAAGRHGGGHRRRRGPGHRQRAGVRRALRRPVRHPHQVRAADAGAAVPARPSTRRAGAASC